MAQQLPRARRGSQERRVRVMSDKEVTLRGLLDAAALMSSPVPVVGDALGLLSDAVMFASEPQSRTIANGLLSAVGVLPMVPNASSFKKVFRASDRPGGRFFAERREDAEAFMDNPGFGGDELFEAEVVLDADDVVDIQGLSRRDELIKLGEEAGMDGDELEEFVDSSMRDTGFIHEVLDDNKKKIVDRLRKKGKKIIRFNDSFPEDSPVIMAIDGLKETKVK